MKTKNRERLIGSSITSVLQILITLLQCRHEKHNKAESPDWTLLKGRQASAGLNDFCVGWSLSNTIISSFASAFQDNCLSEPPRNPSACEPPWKTQFKSLLLPSIQEAGSTYDCSSREWESQSGMCSTNTWLCERNPIAQAASPLILPPRSCEVNINKNTSAWTLCKAKD